MLSALQAKALRLLRARLFEASRDKAEAERNAMRGSQMARADRSERVRTYNWAQGRVTDHRVGLTKHGMDAMLSGGLLDDFIDALRASEREELLKSLET